MGIDLGIFISAMKIIDKEKMKDNSDPTNILFKKFIDKYLIIFL